MARGHAGDQSRFQMKTVMIKTACEPERGEKKKSAVSCEREESDPLCVIKQILQVKWVLVTLISSIFQ